MSCDCDSLDVSISDDQVAVDVLDDDVQVIPDLDVLEIDICEDEIGVIEIDAGVIYFEEDAEVEVVDFVDEIGVIECCEQGLQGPPGVASWSVETSYSSGDVIYYDGVFYEALQASTGDQPDVSPLFWSAVTSGGSGAVDSVNAQTGVVVLDADDIDDTATTNKFVTAGDITNLSNLSGTNTGDQDLSSYLTAVDVDGFYRSNHVEVISVDTTLTQGGTYLVFNTGAPTHLQVTLPDPSTMNGEEIFVVNTPFGFIDVIGPIDGGAGSILPPNTFIAYRAIQLPPSFGGTWLWGSAQRAGIPYDFPDWYDFSTGASVITTGYGVKMGDPGDGVVRPMWADISAPVDSVNTQTGAVVLDADDIDDTSTINKFVTATDVTNLGNLSGTNTGDQDLSGKQDILVSGTNIKTINGSSILGAGDLTLSTGSTGLAFADQEYTSTYCYVGYDSGTSWYIYRRTRATNVREYASGASGYATNWTNRGSLTYV